MQVTHPIGVVVYRGSGTLDGWVSDSLQALPLQLVAIASGALASVPGCLVCLTALGLILIRCAALGTAAMQGDGQ